MGVYHLMGLGTSPGAVTAPLSYMAHRYARWNAEDQLFFERSGEARQRDKSAKVGDVQALVFFTTQEVLTGSMPALRYVDNHPGETIGKQIERAPMKQVLTSLLADILPGISKRDAVDLFWCEIDRRDIQNVYERAIRVVVALAGVGGQGKEMWANLTGGNNVTNFALELAATLSGQIARLYYIQAQDIDAERCVYFTAENGYWVELPVMPLALGRLRATILKIVEVRPCTAEQIYSIVRQDYWDLAHGIESTDLLHDLYLKPMRKQGLLLQTDAGFQIGPQWALIQPFEEAWQRTRDNEDTIEQLAKQEGWITHQTLRLRG